MISHSSLNGVKMHENKEYIMKLKNEMGFKGFIVSDWGSVENITGSSYKEKIIKSVNAGIDMLMEAERYEEARMIIIDAVKNKEISEERVNDAVSRIIKVKKDAGLFEDPMLTNLKTDQAEIIFPQKQTENSKGAASKGSPFANPVYSSGYGSIPKAQRTAFSIADAGASEGRASMSSRIPISAYFGLSMLERR
jgi:beta-glucosidase-like glycosyl hydrolase